MLPRVLPALALALAGLGACGPRVQPSGPGDAPTPTGPHKPLNGRPARQVVVGVMCVNGAGGRPAVTVLAARQTAWSSNDEELTDLLERSAGQEFAVLGYRGARVGVFSAAGLIDVDSEAAVATGGYAGRAPCELRPGGGEEPECTALQGTCGLAVAELRGAATEGAPDVQTGGGCAVGEQLRVDIDGDGKLETFGVRDFLDPMRAPAEEVEAQLPIAGACEPHFATRGLLPETDPKVWRGLDLIAVADLDDDGRRELVLQYRYGDKRTWAIYSATQTPARLELAAEGEPWAQ